MAQIQSRYGRPARRLLPGPRCVVCVQVCVCLQKRAASSEWSVRHGSSIHTSIGLDIQPMCNNLNFVKERPFHLIPSSPACLTPVCLGDQHLFSPIDKVGHTRTCLSTPSSRSISYSQPPCCEAAAYQKIAVRGTSPYTVIHPFHPPPPPQTRPHTFLNFCSSLTQHPLLPLGRPSFCVISNFTFWYSFSTSLQLPFRASTS